jgi:hypothetical protein
MEVFPPSVLNTGSRRSLLQVMAMPVDLGRQVSPFRIEVSQHQIRPSLAKGVVYLQNDGGENTIPRVEVPKRDGIKMIPQESSGSQQVCVRIV